MKEFRLRFLLVCVFVLLLGAGSAALGDWDPGDHHKMHYPQLPKPGGWDVALWSEGSVWLADDWECSETGPVKDIHFWVSWEDDMVSTIGGFSVRIWSNDPCGTNGYSEPNDLLWERDFDAGQFTVRDMPDDLQGWFDPFSGLYVPDDHIMWQQINIVDIIDPWIQKEGEIYWLMIDMGASNCGWKESGSPHFRDNGVYWDGLKWVELEDPTTGDSLDLAFVITGEVKHKRLKWSQPPIEWDPMVDPPRYCGWDELSWRDWIEMTEPGWFDCWDCPTQCHGDADCDGDVDGDDLIILNLAWLGVWPNLSYDECADFDHDLTVGILDLAILNAYWLTNPDPNCAGRPQTWQMAADDYRCLGAMPVESVHWWGSHQGWEEPDIDPPNLPSAWRIGFWSNVPATQRCDFLYGATNAGNLYKIDPSTGGASFIGPIGFPSVTGLSIAPDGTLYGSCRHPVWGKPLLITIDRMTGAGTAVGPIDPTGLQWAVPDISFRANGVLYGYGHNPDQLITIDTATGQGTVVGPTGYVGQGNGMDFAPNGTLYATPSDNQSLVIINPATGAGTDVPGTGPNVPNRVNALEFCESSGVLYGSWNDSWFSGFWYLVTLDLTTGWPTVIGQTVDGLDAITFNTFSHPNDLLWQIEVPADRVDVEQVGYDEYPEIPYYDICYQYYLDLEPDEYFWQHHHRERTTDDIYWLSVAAVYDPNWESIQNPWGWKTRPWSWMDDGVRFWLDENPQLGMVLDPERNMIEPIEELIFGESFDLAFELDTGPNYIKWEQPFTGIRNWPHYEDERSMAWEESGIKWEQPPDTSGWDVAFRTFDANLLLELADDWMCTATGPVTDVHLWYSWENDFIGVINRITVRIYTDDPCDPTIPGDYSEPNELKWTRTFLPGKFMAYWDGDGEQGYYDPMTDTYDWPNHYDYFRIDIDDINNPFIQEEGNIYWVSIELDASYSWAGWKTSTEQNYDDAVYKDPCSGVWKELYDPLSGVSLDLAFVITTEPEPNIMRLVADDWPCEHNEPVTAAAWWGSYIGYEYAACDIEGPWMDLPVPPKYFWLTIWDDVPLGAPGNQYDYSHPNDIIWKYKAYDYDEVLVGYDKHPEFPTRPGREPVFRYSVRLPEEDWFYQEEPNNVYWFGVVAVYDEDANNYGWGWTNHRHVYNDDAVEGFVFGPGGPSDWEWFELYDQTEVNSVDMSFILFSAPDPNAGTCWDAVNQCGGQPLGDATCDGSINFADLFALKLSVFKNAGQVGYNCCADFDHDGSVNFADLFILKVNVFTAGHTPATGVQACPPGYQ